MRQGTLEGAVVAVTGGANGIGAAVASELSAAGAVLEVGDVDDRGVQAAVSALLAVGGTAHGTIVDVRDHQEVVDFLNDVVARRGRLDVVVASAGICDQSPIQEADPAVWREVLETNALGAFHTLGYAARFMAQQGRGDLVAVASVSADITYVGQPAYIASKHALDAFADCLRQEVADQDIRVTVLKPGLVDTPLSRSAAVVDSILTRETALDPQDCARAVRFAVEQPRRCSINQIVMRPTGQVL